MQKRIVIANWKMNPLSLGEAEKLFKNILKNKTKGVDIVVAPPAIFIKQLSKISKKIPLSAQNIFPEESGSFTGEISARMLYLLGTRYSIIGHSERRAYDDKNGENNLDINKKIKACFYEGLTPILCVGEQTRDEKHNYLGFIKEQIESALSGISKTSLDKLIIAYEPVWAIGKNALREATPEEFLEISIFIRRILSDKFGAKNIEKVRIIYGGSVHPENSSGFVQIGKAEGFLVGRDSLNTKKFLEIVKSAE